MENFTRNVMTVELTKKAQRRQFHESPQKKQHFLKAAGVLLQILLCRKHSLESFRLGLGNMIKCIVWTIENVNRFIWSSVVYATVTLRQYFSVKMHLMACPSTLQYINKHGGRRHISEQRSQQDDQTTQNKEPVPKRGANSGAWMRFKYKKTVRDQTTITCKVCRPPKHTNLLYQLCKNHDKEYTECQQAKATKAASSGGVSTHNKLQTHTRAYIHVAFVSCWKTLDPWHESPAENTGLKLCYLIYMIHVGSKWQKRFTRGCFTQQ